jgi:DNA helicase-2/ATP-dependent DNA helicase PcrA
MASIASKRRKTSQLNQVGLDAFYQAHGRALGYLPDPEKTKAIDAPPAEPLYLVAGPGTGKTACLAVRVLKLLFVDAVPPRGIVATTFTKKAAAELRSRILGWGYQLRECLLADETLSETARIRVAAVDVNQIITGTIDSLCADLLTLYRPPGTQPPVEADEYVAATLMLRRGLFDAFRYKSNRLDQVLRLLDGRGPSDLFGWHTGAKSSVLSSLADRRVHDRVDLAAWAAGGRDPDDLHGRDRVIQALDAYDAALADGDMLDFAGIESETLHRLASGMLEDFLGELQVILVDEYQDTNLLQEQLYFELARGCGGALTVVGDDEQSLYRFRGATVELFLDFGRRFKKRFGRRPTPVYLHTNHRSTPTTIYGSPIPIRASTHHRMTTPVVVSWPN